MIWILIWIVCGFVCGYIAGEKNRSVVSWLFAGWILGVFALVAIAAVPARPSVKLRPEVAPARIPREFAQAPVSPRRAASIASGNVWFRPIVFGCVLFVILLILMDRCMKP